MASFESSLRSFSNLRGLDLLLAILIGFVVVAGVRIPPMFAELIDTLAGKGFLVLGVVLLFLRSPLLGILAMIGVFELIRHAEHVTGTAQMRLFLPSDEYKGRFYNAVNQFPVTVEEEMVAKMIPPVYEHPMHVATFTSSRTDIHHASKI